jgi:protein-disulfide isomerase
MQLRTLAVFAAAATMLLTAVGLASAGERPLVLAQANQQATPAAARSFTPEQQAEIGAIIKDYLAANPDFIRDYLIQNPEVIRDAVNELERRRTEQESAAQSLALEANHDLIFNSPRQVVLGNPEGDVTLVEFFDYNCTYCKRSLADLKQLIDGDPRLRIVLKEFPVLGPGSVEAAQVAAAVNLIAPEKYNAFHEELLGGRAPANQERALAVAHDVGVDPAKLQMAMADPAVGETLTESLTLSESLGLTGTPTFIIGDEVVVGAVGYDVLKQKIDEQRAKGDAQ